MMKRKNFIRLTGMAIAAFMTKNVLGEMTELKVQQLLFKDDGLIPNSKYPLLLYKNAFKERGPDGAKWLEENFAKNNWSNSWRNGVFSYHHYHSLSHEVLGIYNGSALLHLGGEKGQKVKVEAGDIIVIPAGVGHKNLGDENSFGVVGAYPDGRTYDILRGEKGNRPKADKNIAALPVPVQDPVLGKSKGLVSIWK